MRRLLFLVCLGACAEAGKAEVAGRPDGSITVLPDGSTIVHPDATAIDAPPGMTTKTLTETTSDTLATGTAIACGGGTTEATYETTANNYYRVFDLAAAGITTDFKVTSVNFQVDVSDGQTAAVRVGTYNGTIAANTASLAIANLTVVASNSAVTIPATQTGADVAAPMTSATIPAGKKMFIEIDSPDGSSTTKYMYMGANTAGETLPGFVMAPVCSINVPTNISQLNTDFPAVNLLMTVTGTY